MRSSGRRSPGILVPILCGGNARPGRAAFERSRGAILIHSRQNQRFSREAAKPQKEEKTRKNRESHSSRHFTGDELEGFERSIDGGPRDCFAAWRLGVRSSGRRSQLVAYSNSLVVGTPVRDALLSNDRGAILSIPDKTRGSHAKPPSRKEEKTQNRESHPSGHLRETRSAASVSPANEFFARSFCGLACSREILSAERSMRKSAERTQLPKRYPYTY